MIFGAIWIVASVLLVLLMGRSIARPIAVLHRGTAALMTSPEDGSISRCRWQFTTKSAT